MKSIALVDKIPRLFRFILAITALTLVILFGMRLIFWWMFNNSADPVPLDNLLYAFYLGTKFDLRLTLYVLLPVLLVGWIPFVSPFRNKVTRYAWLTYLVVAASGVLFFYVVDFGHFAYLHKRVDATVLRFLDNFDTSVDMVWQSYAVIPWSLFIIFLIALDAYVVNHLLRYFARQPAPVIKKRHKLWIAPLGFFVFVFGIFGKFSYYPLRWSDAYFSANAYAASVASNPVLYFFNTMKNKNVVFDENKTREYYDVMSKYLGLTQPDKTGLNYTRYVSPSKAVHNPPPNIVMVFLESFAAYKTGSYGNPLDPTPYFDKIAKQSIFFPNYYAPHTGTARSVFAAVTGLPDIELHKTSTRNPLVVDQHTIINDFKDYEKYYFIGGSANWGNIRGILQNNIQGLHLYEEGDYTRPRMDVWGIDDLSLFMEANWVLRKQQKPFFAIIQTSGNHRPYHLPEENFGFELREANSKALKHAGFISNDEFNAFRFLDHSIRYFIEQAKQEPYFDNTIFVFYGDHGITGYSGDHSKPYLTQTELNGMLTPLILYAPKLLPAQRIEKAASELDLLPTLAGLAGMKYVNTTLGRDLFDPQFDDSRYAFTFRHDKLSTLGLVSQDYYFQIREDGANAHLIDMNADDTTANVVQQHPELSEQMRAIVFGIFETTKYLLYHNKSENVAGP